MIQALYIILFLINFSLHSIPKMVVLTTSYNNKNYYQKNLQALFNQTYTDWVCYYVDDCSTDGTYELAYEFAKSQNMLDKIIFVKNQQNLGALENQYNLISKCDDRQIVIIYDGDDWFSGSDTLEYIHDVYQDPNVWLTYGSYVPVTDAFPMLCKDVVCEKNIDNKSFFRSYIWCFSHLRTFYAALFKKIKKEDLMYRGGFFKFVTDLAAQFPMLEMANGKVKHFKYLDKKLYIYNNMNPLCDFKKNALILHCIERYIRNKKPYIAIDSLF